MDPRRVSPKQTPPPESPPPESGERQAERIRRQSERIAELKRLMRAAAAFARGQQIR